MNRVLHEMTSRVYYAIKPNDPKNLHRLTFYFFIYLLSADD